MRCYFCADVIATDHFPRADEDGSALVLDDGNSGPVQHFAHRQCAAKSRLPHSAMRIAELEPIDILEEGQVRSHGRLWGAELSAAIRRAYRGGWEENSSVVNSVPKLFRIRLNDPDGEGFHRDYLARLVETP